LLLFELLAGAEEEDPACMNSFTTLPKMTKLKKNPDHAAKY
jgi:hypothetical protein